MTESEFHIYELFLLPFTSNFVDSIKEDGVIWITCDTNYVSTPIPRAVVAKNDRNQGVHSVRKVRNVRKRQELGKMSGNCQEKSCFLEKCQDCQEIVSSFPSTKILYLYFMSLKVKDPCCWYVILVHMAHLEIHFPKIFVTKLFHVLICQSLRNFALTE